MKSVLFLFLVLASLNISFSQSIENKEYSISFTEQINYNSKNNLTNTSTSLKLEGVHGEFESLPIISPIENPEPFLAVSYKIYSSKLEEENFNIYFRTSYDNKNWNEWNLLEVDHHGEPLENEFSGALQFFEKETKYFQFKIELKQSDKILTPEVEEIKLIFISPGATPQSKLDKIEQIRIEDFNNELKNSNNNIESSYPRPPFVDRVTWGCPYPTGYPGNPNWMPSLTTPTHLVVHHSAGTNSSSDWAAVVRSYWSLHVNSNGWSDLGYNWLVDATGVLYQGRQFRNGNENVVGAHFSGANGATMGVCVMGTFTSISPSQQALKMLVRILAYKAAERNINPRGISYHSSSQLTINNICGHRDGPGATECPGTNLWNQLPAIRNRVFALLNPPLVEGTNADSISETTAYIFSSVNPRTSQTEAYFQWGTTPAVIFNAPIVPVGSGNEPIPISRQLTSLQPSTKYYYRAVGRNSDTLTYGETKYFMTLGIPLNVELVLPENNSVIESDSVLFVWKNAEPYAENYHFQISEDSLFNNLIINITIEDTFYVYSQFEDNKNYWWRVAGENSFGIGEFGEPRSFTTIITNIQNEFGGTLKPEEFKLLQNYPNPFNPSTVVTFQLAVESYVNLKVYDILGNEVATLVNEYKNVGNYSVTFNAEGLSSGIYYYKLTAINSTAELNFEETRKMILMK